ncbi:MAG: S8 family peptidase [Tenacibaculum sp.]|nr:S8 family peptidase [Tenacibaculum sp.]
MKTLKLASYSLVVASILASCTSTKQVASKVKMSVPQGVDTSVNISAKKSELTNYEKNNWQHLDLATDTIPGMSVNKAYKFLEGKKSTPVVVCVLDSGTDLKHEDLKDVAWVNTKEVAGNGIDDDKNGYVDDINGWNFLGKSYKEHLEYERILMNPSIASPELVKEVEEYQAKKVEEAKNNKERYDKMLYACKRANSEFVKYFGKENYTDKEIQSIKTENEDLNKAIGIATQMAGFGVSVPQAIKEISKIVEKADKTIKGENLKTDYRTVVGDNAYDINDKPGYGDANTGHSEKGEAHGSHVAGIIAATRNNNKGMDGVANNVKIMAVRSVSDGDEYDKDVALGIRYAVDNGAKVINTSFGKAFSPNKEWVFDAIKYAEKHDVLIVNAAGNDGKNIDIEKTFPNDAPDLVNEIADNFLTVGAMSSNYNEKLPASFSNYGKVNVDVFAPGVQIYSTTPENEYKKFNGTSMASPNAAGVAALIRSYYPTLSAGQVKKIIMNSGTLIPFKVIKPGSEDLVPFSDLSVSGRVVNAYNALRMADEMVNGKK